MGSLGPTISSHLVTEPLVAGHTHPKTIIMRILFLCYCMQHDIIELRINIFDLRIKRQKKESCII